jgi:hypothetical protein
MALPNLTLIEALRATVQLLRDGSHYAWGHHGSCNCGHLLQVVTKLDKQEIMQYARTGAGEWTELAEDYCGVTDAPVSLLIKKLQDIGLTPSDIHNIEYLEDKEILKALPGGFRWLKRNLREDVCLYLETMAEVLEEKLLKNIVLPAEMLQPRKVTAIEKPMAANFAVTAAKAELVDF